MGVIGQRILRFVRRGNGVGMGRDPDHGTHMTPLPGPISGNRDRKKDGLEQLHCKAADTQAAGARQGCGMEMIWGFPAVPVAGEQDGQNLSGLSCQRQAGVSLLIAIMAIAVMMTFVSEMIVSSAVNIEMALLGKDRIKAEYMARSGLNLGVYLLSATYLWDHVQASGPLGLAASKKPVDGPESLWNLVNTLPPLGSDAMSFLDSVSGGEKKEDPFKLSGFMNSKIAEQMRLLEGQFTIRIADEKGKININDCFSTSERSACEEVLIQLEALFSCPAEKAFLESKNLNPKEVAYRIRDFIMDSDRISPYSNLDSKDGPYEAEVPPYQAKRAPLDTLEELRLVKGWDDGMHAVFSPYLTIYPLRNTKTSATLKSGAGLININSAPGEMLRCFFPKAQEPDFREQSLRQLYALRKKEKNFSSDGTPAAIKQKLQDFFGYTGEGVEREAEKAEKWFTVDSDYFRFQVEAMTGHQQRRLTAVIRRVNSSVKDHSVRLREVRRAWQVLYWKMI